MLLYFKISHIRLNWILFAFQKVTTRIFILIFIFNAHNFPAKTQMKVFHFQKFATIDNRGGIVLLQNILVVVLLGREKENPQVSPNFMSKEANTARRLTAGQSEPVRGAMLS